jgi:phosphopantetheinyl transferase (holo-ACP synthase)
MPVWAGRVLGRRERELFDALTVPEPRKLEWLAARTAAKECVAELLLACHGIELLAAEIEILPDERGAPVVLAPGLDGLPELPVVSLTHSQGRAAALAALVPAGGGVGIDLERIVQRPPGFAEAALTAPERALLAELSGAEAEEWLLRLWCAKEAAGKALGRGLGAGEGAPRVTAIASSPEGDRDRELASVDTDGHHLLVWMHREDDLVVASTVHIPSPNDQGPREADQ